MILTWECSLCILRSLWFKCRPGGILWTDSTSGDLAGVTTPSCWGPKCSDSSSYAAKCDSFESNLHSIIQKNFNALILFNLIPIQIPQSRQVLRIWFSMSIYFRPITTLLVVLTISTLLVVVNQNGRLNCTIFSSFDFNTQKLNQSQLRRI